MVATIIVPLSIMVVINIRRNITIFNRFAILKAQFIFLLFFVVKEKRYNAIIKWLKFIPQSNRMSAVYQNTSHAACVLEA